MIQFPVFTFKLLTVRSHLSTRCSYHYCVHTSQHKVAQPMLPYHSPSKTQPPPPNATITTKCHHTHFHSLPAHHTHLYLPLLKLVRLFIYLNSTHTHAASQVYFLTSKGDYDGAFSFAEWWIHFGFDRCSSPHRSDCHEQMERQRQAGGCGDVHLYLQGSVAGL